MSGTKDTIITVEVKTYNHLCWLLKRCDPLAIPVTGNINIISQIGKEVERLQKLEQDARKLIYELQVKMVQLQQYNANLNAIVLSEELRRFGNG